ncbi:MAG: nucleotidyltransferase family protein, partial [Bdellovibrionota bacterium]
APLLPGDTFPDAPRFFQESVERAKKFTLASNISQLAALSKARETLQRAEIPSFALKGAALLESGIYQPGERAMSDVDVLVQRKKLEEALSVLVANGWREEFPEKRDYFLRHHHNLRLLRKEGSSVVLELHWTPAHGERRMPEWDDVIPGSGNGESYLFPRSSQLHFLSVNAALHGYTGRLLFLYDLRRLIEHPGEEIDWTCFAALGEKTGTLQASLLALACAREVFRAPVPEEILKAQSFTGRFFLRSLVPSSKWNGAWRSRALRLLMADSFLERARLIGAGGGRWLARRT